VDAGRAYQVIHEPQSMAEAELAKKRLIFEEFFVFSAGLSLMRAARAEKKCAPYDNLELRPFLASLPFALTGAQNRAISDILRDFRRGAPMNRLVQGDVGSGKTMVAAAAAYCAAGNGFQSALMAPTEILAEQHYHSLKKLFEPLGITAALLTGSMTAREKRLTREALAAGEIQVVVGTHALITDSTQFNNLGLVIADEQHRFGVAQRSRLSAKGEAVHLLVRGTECDKLTDCIVELFALGNSHILPMYRLWFNLLTIIRANCNIITHLTELPHHLWIWREEMESISSLKVL
jgi:ATP-dependent DNA helicase RecG